MDLAYLNACLSYDKEGGVFLWKQRPLSHFTSGRVCNAWNTRYAGYEAGNRAPHCRSVKIDGKPYKLHRLAWLFITGSWPEGDVDHRDGDPHNNAWANLRLATNQQNQYNGNRRRNNTSGFKGVCWDKPVRRWRATIAHNRKSVFLGHYDTPEEAAAAYAGGAKLYAKEFARTC